MGVFTSFAFPATGQPTARTLPDRLAEIKNVKDFGATGDGVTDDWPAIMAAFNWITGDSTNRGTIYFPPGTYFVSRPIDFSGPGISSIWRGHLGASTIMGNFADYVLSRSSSGTSAESGGHVIEGLTIINTNASGGGIRLGESIGGAIRDCTITATKGINTANTDILIGNAYWGSMEIGIENCNISPGSNTIGSQGILSMSDGPIINCRIVGFQTGISLFGGEGGMTIVGCHFEQNVIGIYSGVGIDRTLTDAATGNIIVSACRFKNNSIAIRNGQSRATFAGLRIEGSNGAAPEGANPQYGILLEPGQTGISLFEGIIVVGQYDIAGICVAGAQNTFMGVQSTNAGAGQAWILPTTASGVQFYACNVAPVYTMAKLPVTPFAITAASYDSNTGLATITVNFSTGLATQNANITVSGITPAGYNGFCAGASCPTNMTITYPISNPGGPGVGFGTVLVNGVDGSGLPQAQEGDCYNVSDASTATWGATPVRGGGARAKVRWSGSNWTVMGI